MIKNKQEFSNSDSKLKNKRYGFKISTAGVRKSNDSYINNQAIPTTSIRRNNDSRFITPEERNRNGSIRSHYSND